MDMHGAVDINEVNGTKSDSKQTFVLRRSGRAGNSGRKLLTDVGKLRENVRNTTAGPARQILYGNIAAETTQKIGPANSGQNQATARVEIKKRGLISD